MKHLTNPTRAIHFVVLAFLMMLSSPVQAQDFDKGLAAAQAGDYATAIKEWQPLALAGDRNLQLNIGIMYAEGLGVVQDYREAAKWYRLSAEQGAPQAQFNLGILYLQGQGIEQNHVEAAKWHLMAAEQGFTNARRNLASFYEEGLGVRQDFAKAIKWYRLAAGQGDVGSMINLDVLYAKGLTDLIGQEEADEWLLMAAKQGSTLAQSKVGARYIQRQEYSEAIKWVRLAAEGGFANAQHNLGSLHRLGQGVLQDNVLAQMWYNVASINGASTAAAWRDKLAGLMTNADISKAQAMARECMNSGYTKCGY